MKLSSSSWCISWGETPYLYEREGKKSSLRLPNLFSRPNLTTKCENVLKESLIWRDEKICIFTPNPSLQLAFSSTKRFVVVGDIWLTNRQELLQQLGTVSNQNTDCQIVAELWERWGVESLTKLVGMFALAVCDRELQVLYNVRDRVGSYTLYYTNQGSTRWIAPQLRTLAPYHSQDLDLVALRDYLCCAFVPGEQTLWQQVRELRPGTYLTLPDERIQVYWQVQEQITDSNQSLQWHSTQLRNLLNQVIPEYLPTNQPVGVFLSGGLDSSCVTALATKFHTHPVHTYSIHFGEDCPNELEFSSLVANHCQTQHHILEITFKQMWEYLVETMADLDDPIGDPLTVPNLLIAKLAKQTVEIVLNGEGGDPCFGGPKNQPMLLNSLYSSVSNRRDYLSAYLLSFQKCAANLPQLLKPEVWNAVKQAPSVFEADLNSDANYLNRLMRLNIKFKGADQILTKVNNISHAVGLTARSPLFDQRVVELSMKIPPEYKLSGVQEKAVLKQAVADLLPQAILERPKSGMMVPVQLGFRKFWQRQAQKLLLSRNAAIAPYLNQSLIRELLNYQGDTWNRYGVKLWLLVSLEIWLQGNITDGRLIRYSNNS
ncbi:MAG TPA: asparagine synthase-related protein [Oculatellaceae cyanobacterium]